LIAARRNRSTFAAFTAALLVAMVAMLATAVRAEGVDAAKSEIAFSITQMGVRFDGRFDRWRGDIDFRSDALARSTAAIDIDLASVDLASDDSDAAARGPLWLDTAKYPIASFRSTAITVDGGNRYRVTGRLTLKGITRDCVVPIQVTTDGAGNRVATGTFTLKRLEYHVGEGEWADPATVADDIAVRIRMVLPASG
jgi:polyisoprenoid-binding protein YceI